MLQRIHINYNNIVERNENKIKLKVNSDTVAQ